MQVASLSLTPKVVGIWANGRIRALVRWSRGAWYLMIAYFPIPSENKWRGMVEVVALLPQALEEEGAPQVGASSSKMAGLTLERVGDRWSRRRAAWLEGSRPSPRQLQMVLTLAFKTLDLPTTMRAQGPELEAVTARCPYVEQAGTPAAAQQVCRAVCSEAHSLFRGMVQGLPCHVSYHAPTMMGFGDPVCVKRFRVM